MSSHHLRKIRLAIGGMHCASCEVLIERRFKKIPGVERVHVDHARGRASVLAVREPELREFQETLVDKEYTVAPWSERNNSQPAHVAKRNTGRDYLEIGIAALLVLVLLAVLRRTNILPEGFGVTTNMSYGFVFVIGLVAAMSTCIAVTGGLLVAVAAAHNARHPDVKGFEKFKPHLLFNAGRVASYTVLGGAVGGLGSVFTPSARLNGAITIGASIVMIILGFQLLKLFPGLKKFQPKMPKFLAHKIHDASSTQSKWGPMLLGASTFFLPCGFTQALQLYVLSQGNIVIGALTMFFFSLGTVPALIGLGAISSFSKGLFQRYFLKVAGVMVIIIGFSNINNGLIIAGSPLTFASLKPARAQSNAPSEDPSLLPIQNGVQIAEMKVSGYQYSPGHFTVRQGMPVEWRIDGINAAGCGRVLVVPALNMTKYLNTDSITTVTFTPSQTGNIRFNCSMGMMSPSTAAFTVVTGSGGNAETAPNSKTNPIPCDPRIAECLPTQNR